MRNFIIGIFCSCFCMNLSAQTYEEWVMQGMDAIERDSLLLAETCFKEALKLEPASVKNALLFSNMGTIQRRMGKKKEAMESYSMALNLTPYSVTMLLNRASLYLELDYLDKAYVDYCNVIDLEPQNLEALQFRAYIYTRKRQYADARTDYQQLLIADPGNKTARLGLALVNQKDKRFQEALEELNRLVVDYPRDASLLKARAELEVEMNTLELAVMDLENAALLTPHDSDIYVMCGEIYLQQGKKREAYAAFEKAIELGVPRAELQDRLKLSK